MLAIVALLAGRYLGWIWIDAARVADLDVWRIGPEAHAAIVSIIAHGEVTGGTVRARLAPVHELAHLTVECR